MLRYLSLPLCFAVFVSACGSSPSTPAPVFVPPSNGIVVSGSDPAKFNLIFLGRNTSFDLTHDMGEVTNIYATTQNAGSQEANEVRVTVSAADEGWAHPDKNKTI